MRMNYEFRERLRIPADDLEWVHRGRGPTAGELRPDKRVTAPSGVALAGIIDGRAYRFPLRTIDDTTSAG